MSLETPSLPNVPGQPAPPPMFGEGKDKKKKGQGSMQPTFLGTGSIPQVNQLGQKTLLGQ